ncbi:hypothetical protein DDE18_08075 [Nocardioides gansuensis]|uniref:Histidine kinase/HSP90-like ATPase domain-containing protein n=1 Tax=Nocardioides gansuensis TaxID=2138300 RepID=A0A2T8FC10_9ACTN|nr:ATP-binding protein [Nocardioides gansuensis]PVG83247.1 hypothetical protein DDE18_08075 [Nocardioides gansuensis]
MEQVVSFAPGRAAGVDVWARAALERLGALPSVRRVGVALVEGGGRRLFFTASDRDNAERVDWCQIDAYLDVPLNTAVRTSDLVAGDLTELAVSYPEFISRQTGATPSLAAVPLRAAGQVLGGVVLFYVRPQPFDAAQRRELEELGADLGARLRAAQRASRLPSRSLEEEPVPPGARVATHPVAPDPQEVSRARSFLRGQLTAWEVDDDTLDTAVLCLSELVTNAIVHTAGGCEVRAVLDEEVLTVTVRDGGADRVDPDAEAEPLAAHGRGLALVAALSRRWGSELDAAGTTAWFVLEPGLRRCSP